MGGGVGTRVGSNVVVAVPVGTWLFHCGFCMILAVVSVLCAAIGISHKPSPWLRFPCKIVLPFFMAYKCSFDKMTLHSSSQSYPNEIRLELLRAGRIIACCPDGVRWDDKGMCPMPVDWRASLLGCWTNGPLMGWMLRSTWQSDSFQ